MIITSKYKLEIGKIYTENNVPGKPNFDFEDKRYFTFRFLVMKEVSKEDYIMFLIKNYGPDIENFIYLDYYYKISMD